MKKLLYFADFPLNIGGASKVLLTQAYIMRKKGYSVLVVIPNDQNDFHMPEYDQICRLYGLSVITAQFQVYACMERIDILDVMKSFEAIRKIVLGFKPDLMHSVQLNIAVELVAREFKIPHLMNIYQTDEEQFAINWLNVYPQYHSADSDLFSRRWGEGLGITSRCIRVAYERKGEVNKHSEKKLNFINIIVIGILCERKNQMEIIKFILECKAHRKKVLLTLLGEDNNLYGEKCKRFVEENGLQENVSFVGFDLAVENYLEKADLLILASTVESYPGVLVESMANKVPIIATPVAGVPELLTDKENSFLTNGFEAKDIYHAFLRYEEYRRSGKLSRIIDNAYATYLQYHTYLQVGDQLKRYYEWIIKDYRGKENSFLKLTDIRQLFDQYMCNRKIDKTDSEVRSLLWFLYHVFMLVDRNDNKKIVIWGAGALGKKVVEWIRIFGTDQLELIGFIDNNKKGMYLGYPIIQNKDLALEECGTVFVAVVEQCARLEIMTYLDKLGKTRNRDYFMAYNTPVRI